MPTLIWPVNLPQTLPVDTEETRAVNVIETDMDAGPKKKRRRFTAASEYLEPPADRFVLDLDQRDTLKSFFKTETAEGSLEFVWQDPLPAAGLLRMRIEGQPTYSAITSGFDRLFRCSIKFEVLP